MQQEQNLSDNLLFCQLKNPFTFGITNIPKRAGGILQFLSILQKLRVIQLGNDVESVKTVFTDTEMWELGIKQGQNMNIIISIIIAIAVFFAVSFSLDEFTRMRGNDILLLAFFAGVTALVISWCNIKIQIGKAGSTMASDALGAIKDVKETIESNIDSKQAEFFSIAEQEYEDGEIDKGLWSQALVKAKGDENLRKVEYMKLRAKQLKKKK